MDDGQDSVCRRKAATPDQDATVTQLTNPKVAVKT